MRHYSKQGLWSLFLLCAFPLHAWTLILAFRDFSWVAERTNSWDAVGVVAYGLLFALVESVVISMLATALGYLISRVWAEDRRIALLSTLVLVASLWVMAEYLFFMLGVKLSGQTIDFLVSLNHPLRFLYAISLVCVVITVILPTYLILRSDRFFKAIRSVFERLSLLTLFYLFFDFIGLVLVLVRNI